MTGAARAREGVRLDPVYLVEIGLGGGGPTLLFSDRSITVGGVMYEDYLDDLSGIGVELSRMDSSGRNAAIALSFRNERWGAYERLIEVGETYPFEGASCLIAEVYLDVAGEPSEEVVLFVGVLDEPREIDLMGFRCGVSSMEFRADNKW